MMCDEDACQAQGCEEGIERSDALANRWQEVGREGGNHLHLHENRGIKNLRPVRFSLKFPHKCATAEVCRSPEWWKV